MEEKEALILDTAKRSVEFRKSLTLPRHYTTSQVPDEDHNLCTFKEVSTKSFATTDASGMEIDCEIRSQISKKQFFMQIVRASVGTGVIALPSAVANAGLVFGMLGILLVSGIVINSIHLLVETAQFLRKQYNLKNVNLDYGNTVECAFVYGPDWGRRLRWTSKLLNVCLGITQFGICSVYILFVSENIKYLVDHFDPNFQQPLFVYLILVTLVITPLTFIRSIRILSNISGFGNIFMLLAVVLILVYCFQDIPDVTQYPYITDINRIPLFFGVTIFAFESITVVLPNENALEDKESLRGYGGLLNLSFGLVLVCYLTVAFYGYAKFGEDVKGSITYSIPLTPWYFMLVKPIYAFLIFVSFGIQFYVFVEVIWQSLRPHITEKDWLRHVCSMISLVVMTGCAATVPHVEHMISLIGALSGAALCLIFPALVHTVTFWDHQPSKQKFQCMVVKNSFVICFGLFGALIGSYSSLLAIFDAFERTDNFPDIPEER